MTDAALHPFPRMESLDVKPLHMPLHEPELYYACTAPERPGDPTTVWDWRCRACTLHARAVIVNQGDNMVHWDGPNHAHHETMLSRLVERAEYWLAQS